MTYTRSTKTNVHIEGILKTHKNKTYEHSMNINFSLQTDFKTFQTFSSLHAYTHTHMRFKMSAKKKTEGFLLEQTEKKKKRRSNEQQKQQQRRWRPKKKKWWWWHILLYYDVSLLLTTRIEYRMKWIKARKGNEKRVKISIICGNELEGDNNNKSENFSIQIANQSFVAWDSCIFNGKYFFLCVNVCVWWAFNHGLEMRDNMHTHVCVAKSIDSIDFGFFFSTFRFFFFCSNRTTVFFFQLFFQWYVAEVLFVHHVHTHRSTCGWLSVVIDSVKWFQFTFGRDRENNRMKDSEKKYEEKPPQKIFPNKTSFSHSVFVLFFYCVPFI